MEVLHPPDLPSGVTLAEHLDTLLHDVSQELTNVPSISTVMKLVSISPTTFRKLLLNLGAKAFKKQNISKDFVVLS